MGRFSLPTLETLEAAPTGCRVETTHRQELSTSSPGLDLDLRAVGKVPEGKGWTWVLT